MPPYFNLGDALARPRMRALRALRFFDEVSFPDLEVACEITDHERDVGTFRLAVAHAVEVGEIEKNGSRYDASYRITTKGRKAVLDLHERYARAIGHDERA